MIYNPDTGEFSVRTYPTGDGRYIRLTFLGKARYAHDVAVFLMTGEWPKGVDHKDRDGHNNKWSNLRVAGQELNGHNRGKQINNTGKWKGVTKRVNHDSYFARIKVGKKQLYLGSFRCETAAAIAYDKAAIKLVGEFAGTNIPRL